MEINLFYKILNIILECIHIILILWILIGWSIKKIRIFHFITINIILFFWFIVGFFYGFGYCPLTDYHWKIKSILGEKNLPYSYISYLLYKFNIYINESIVDIFVLTITITIYIVSFFLIIKNK